MKMIVLSPHRDDAAFSVGLAIATWLDAGHEVEVMNCFTESEYSPFGDMTLVHADDLREQVSALRHREDILWSERYPRSPSLLDLKLWDAPQRLSCTIDQVCSTPVRAGDPAMAAIRSSLENHRPEALVLPLAMGDHVDHLTARLATQDGWPRALPVAFYEDLPYSARPGAAQTIESRVASLGLPLEPVFATNAAAKKPAIERKRVFSRCYNSQIDADVVEQIAQFCERYDGRERLWVNAAWRESGLGAWQ